MNAQDQLGVPSGRILQKGSDVLGFKNDGAVWLIEVDILQIHATAYLKRKERQEGAQSPSAPYDPKIAYVLPYRPHEVLVWHFVDRGQ